jgi:hypothetical protein
MTKRVFLRVAEVAFCIALIAAAVFVFVPDTSRVDAQQRAGVRLVAPYRVTVGAAAVQLTTSGNVHGIVIKAMCPGQTIYIGASSAVTTATGYPMVDGETLSLEATNANQVYAIASAGGQSVAVLPYSRVP